MSARRSLGLPIVLAIAMTAIVLVLAVGWVFLAVLGIVAAPRFAGISWVLLSMGSAFLGLLLVGVILYLGLSVKAINLSRRQSNFIDSVTHEFKSPLASMKLCLQTLSRRRLSDEQRADFYRFMLEDLERLDQLVDHVLAAGQVDAPPKDNEAEEVPLAEVLEQCAVAVCHRYRVSDDTVRLAIAPVRLWARRIDVELILRNLLDNAVKYAGEEPRVEVSAYRRPSGNLVMRVRDNGTGVPRKLRRRIFGRFVRLSLGLQRAKSGTGLGLHIVRTLVRRLGGRVRVCDPENGWGGVFEVELPRARVIDGPAGQGGAAKASASGTENARSSIP